jgi:hypothetical protein
MKTSKLGRFKIYRWITRILFGRKWSKGYLLPATPKTGQSSRDIIPRIWSP